MLYEVITPEDIGGMNVAKGILTARGGMTSHAAVVARGMGKCCVSGAGAVKINYKTRIMTIDGKEFREGDWVSRITSYNVCYTKLLRIFMAIYLIYAKYTYAKKYPLK